MTNDDTLLAGFLDRSLSEDQLLELEARKAADPEFAQQFTNMLTVEGMLVKATPKANIPAHFLNTVENSVAASVLVGGAAAGAGSGGFLSGLSSAWSWLGGAALILVSGSTLYYVNQSAPSTVVVPQQPSILVQPASEPVIEQKIEQPVEQPDPSASDKTSSAPSSTPDPTTQTPDPAPDGGDGTSYGANSKNSETALNLAIEDYNNAVGSNADILATTRAITLGQTYRDRKELTRSSEYFGKAVEHARKAKLVAEEVTALGEQAKTSILLGNETQARLLLNQAISRGSLMGTDVSVWTRILKDLR